MAALPALVACASVGDPVYHPGTTRKILQITGETDTPLRRPTLSQTRTRFGLISTDLGSSFEHEGNLYFLFGDTFVTGGIHNVDAIAMSTSTDPRFLTLDFPVGSNGKFSPIVIPGITQGAFEVPSYGISVNGKIYIIHTTDWYGAGNNMERSVLARSDDDGRTWTKIYDLSAAVSHDMTNAHFINVAMAEINAEQYPGELPFASGPVVLIWGSGAYRASNPYLACIPSAQIENKSMLRYFSGFSGGTPQWSTQESSAAPLFAHPVIGEFSAAWIPQVQRWVFLYNSISPRGITMRTSLKPWGPFGAGQIIMDPFADWAYGRYMHIPWSWARRDAFHDNGKEDTWGGEYGPYIIPRFTTGNAQRCQIYYVMSTWNPYQSILVRSEIGEPLPTPPSGINQSYFVPGDTSWNRTSSDFYVNFMRDTLPYISTYTALGDAATGMMWRWLPRDSLNTLLTFEIHGGHGEVILLEGGGDIPVTGIPVDQLYTNLKRGDYGDVVQCTWGHDSNDFVIPVEWSLTPFDSANLKVVVIDPFSTGSWDFISVSRMMLTRRNAPVEPTPTASLISGWTSF